MAVMGAYYRAGVCMVSLHGCVCVLDLCVCVLVPVSLNGWMVTNVSGVTPYKVKYM